MPNYNIKREAEIFVVSGTGRFPISVKEVSFGQTFKENSYTKKTINNQTNYFEGSTINQANAANFDFSVSVLAQDDYNILHTLLLGPTSFDLYIDTSTDIFKLESAVITNAVFIINKAQPLSLQIQGEASRLHRGASLTGTLQTGTAQESKTFISPSITVTLDGGSTLSDIVSISMELQNDISWIPYATLQDSLSVTNYSNSMFPSGFYVNKKTLSGSIQQYLTDSNTSNTLSWDTDVTLSIKAGSGAGASFRGFHLDAASCSFTNRISTGQLFMQSYDWRMIESPTSLGTKLKYTTD